jgi:hypothetical protein
MFIMDRVNKQKQSKIGLPSISQNTGKTVLHHGQSTPLSLLNSNILTKYNKLKTHNDEYMGVENSLMVDLVESNMVHSTKNKHHKQSKKSPHKSMLHNRSSINTFNNLQSMNSLSKPLMTLENHQIEGGIEEEDPFQLHTIDPFYDEFHKKMKKENRKSTKIHHQIMSQTKIHHHEKKIEKEVKNTIYKIDRNEKNMKVLSTLSTKAKKKYSSNKLINITKTGNFQQKKYDTFGINNHSPKIEETSLINVKNNDLGNRRNSKYSDMNNSNSTFKSCASNNTIIEEKEKIETLSIKPIDIKRLSLMKIKDLHNLQNESSKSKRSTTPNEEIENGNQNELRDSLIQKGEAFELITINKGERMQTELDIKMKQTKNGQFFQNSNRKIKDNKTMILSKQTKMGVNRSSLNNKSGLNKSINQSLLINNENFEKNLINNKEENINNINSINNNIGLNAIKRNKSASRMSVSPLPKIESVNAQNIANLNLPPLPPKDDNRARKKGNFFKMCFC